MLNEAFKKCHDARSRCHDARIAVSLIRDEKTDDWKRDKNGWIITQYRCIACNEPCELKEKEG